MKQLFANNARTAVATTLAIGGTSLTVSDGSVFPAVGTDEYFLVTLFRLTGNVESGHEVVKVTDRSSDVLTIERSYEGASATEFLAGSLVALRPTAKTLEEMQDAANIISTPSDNIVATNVQAAINELDTEKLAKDLLKSYFKKTDSSAVIFTKTGNFTVDTSQEFYAEAGGAVLTIASGTAITMPTATTGTDYAVWLKTDGALEATANFTTPPATGARKIGGFHYAAGGNASAQAGGDTTPQINEYSFWDLNFRPSTDDPRGMTLVAGSFWSDIYLLNTAPDVNGTSKYGETIADGSSPPVIPATLGGNGATTFGSLTWFEAMSIATAMGKKALTQPEFMTAMYGVTESTSRGTDPVTTGLDAPRTSRWGVMQATGNLWIWAQDRGGPNAAASWNANTEGFGSEFSAPNGSRLGGTWNDGVIAGSRSSTWSNTASISSNNIGVRLVCDHLQLD